VHASEWTRMRGALGRAIAALVGAGPRFQRGVALGVSQLLAGDRSIPGQSPGAARRVRVCVTRARRRRTKTKPRFPSAPSHRRDTPHRAAYPSGSSRLTTPRETPSADEVMGV
jgi:hypothetical protein